MSPSDSRYHEARLCFQERFCDRMIIEISCRFSISPHHVELANTHNRLHLTIDVSAVLDQSHHHLTLQTERVLELKNSDLALNLSARSILGAICRPAIHFDLVSVLQNLCPAAITCLPLPFKR